jgi:hypothetical protein
VVLDGVIVWDEPLDEAPETVRAMVGSSQLLLDLLATAPRPDVSWETDGDAWLAWSRDVMEPHFAPFSEVAAQVGASLCE